MELGIVRIEIEPRFEVGNGSIEVRELDVCYSLVFENGWIFRRQGPRLFVEIERLFGFAGEGERQSEVRQGGRIFWVLDGGGAEEWNRLLLAP